RPRVPLGLEPELAAVPVVPPLALDTGDVLPEVEVARQLAEARRALRSHRDLTLVRELVDVPRAAVWTREQERHQPVASVTVGVQVPRVEGPPQLVSLGLHLGGRLGGDPLRALAGQEGLEAHAERLDLFELVDGERRDARAAPRHADDEPLALEPSQCVADRR